MTHTPPRRTLLIGGLAAALVVLAAAAVAVYLLAGRGPVPAAATVAAPADSSAPAASKAPKTYTAFGSLTVGSSYEGKPECHGSSGYSDLKAGATVTIHDASGQAAAQARLGPGQPGTGGCVFQFIVTGIPGGRGPYSVAIGSHLGPEVTESDLGRGAATDLTLP